MNKILLVGELNPYGAKPEYALYPLPAHASGARLMNILGLTPREYLKEHDRVNLCTGKWDTRGAEVAALQLHGEREGCGIVLCGVKVAAAFRRAAAYTTAEFRPLTLMEDYGRHYLTLPHPSGRNLLWNDPETARVARHSYDVLRATLGLPAIRRTE